jgi:hypothetical protein
VDEEAIAISVYCALKCKDDFKKALVLAVNHNGDSDSTGTNCIHKSKGQIICSFCFSEGFGRRIKYIDIYLNI